ncbi:MAG: hypothetical protein R8M38_09100, partial [Mariprofundaceae bacterium]
TLIESSRWDQVDEYTVDLTVIDGDIYDQDQKVDGIIIDPLAFGRRIEDTATEPQTPPEEPIIEVSIPEAPIEPVLSIPTVSTDDNNASGGCLLTGGESSVFGLLLFVLFRYFYRKKVG